MKPQIKMFQFTLGPKQSIGPAQLQALWVRACQTPHVSVGRSNAEGRPLYSLYASQQLQNLGLVEQRLRRLLDDSKLNAALIPLHTH